MTDQTFALLYAAFAVPPMALHLAVAAGAPVGRFTVGGRFPGQLPPLWRALALVQAVVLTGMALVVLGQADIRTLPGSDTLFWPVVGLTALTCLANVLSPSPLERRLWTPITVAMLATALGAALA